VTWPVLGDRVVEVDEAHRCEREHRVGQQQQVQTEGEHVRVRRRQGVGEWVATHPAVPGHVLAVHDNPGAVQHQVRQAGTAVPYARQPRDSGESRQRRAEQ
jgi:hypothetical protein